MSVAKEAYLKFIDPTLKKSNEMITAFIQKAQSTTAVTDGSGRGISNGLRFIWPSKEVIEEGLCFRFDEFRGNEYCQLLVEEAGTGKLVAITVSKLNTFAREVSDTGDSTGKTDQPQGELAEMWREPGNRATIYDRTLHVADLIEKLNKELVFKVTNERPVKVNPFPDDRAAGKPFSEVVIYDFVLAA